MGTPKVLEQVHTKGGVVVVYGRFVALIDLCIKLLNMLKKQMMKEQAELLAVFAETDDEGENVEDMD